jgi:hypothetical protein
MNERGTSPFPPAVGDEFESCLDDDRRARFKAELEPGERLLWAGSSNPPPERFGWEYLLFGAIAAFLFLLGTTALADAFGRFGRRPPEQPTVVGGLTFYGFSGAIVIALFANLIKSRARRRAGANVFYAVTDRRTISWVPDVSMGGVRVRSLPRSQIVDVMRVQRSDGSGTLEFVCSAATTRYNYHSNEFKHINEVHRVEQIVRKNLIASEETMKECERTLDTFT